MKFSRKSVFSVFLLALFALALAGCASTESDNVSTRPWNAPKGWQHGVPGIDSLQR